MYFLHTSNKRTFILALHQFISPFFGVSESIHIAAKILAKFLYCYYFFFKASEQIEVGAVAVNHPLVAQAEAPFGGIKQTGDGREGGSMAIKDYLNIKYTHLGIKG